MESTDEGEVKRCETLPSQDNDSTEVMTMRRSQKMVQLDGHTDGDAVYVIDRDARLAYGPLEVSELHRPAEDFDLAHEGYHMRDIDGVPLEPWEFAHPFDGAAFLQSRAIGSPYDPDPCIGPEGD